MLIFFVLLPTLSLTACTSNCSTCSGTSAWQCTKCASGYYLYPPSLGFCKNFCPTGYTLNAISRTCDGIPDVIFDFVLDKIEPTIVDKYKGILGLNGATTAYYPPAFEDSDPIPSLKRGYYFSGGQYVQVYPPTGFATANLVVRENASVLMWVRLDSCVGGAFFGKNVTDIQDAAGGNTMVVWSQSCQGRLMIGAGQHLSSVLSKNHWHCLTLSIAFDTTLGQSVLSSFVDATADTPTLVPQYIMDAVNGFVSFGQEYDPPKALSDFYTGYIWEVKLYNYALDLTTHLTEIAGVEKPASATSQLSWCLITQYISASGTCVNCSPTCVKGCVSASNCNLCSDPLCAQCLSFYPGSCTLCKANAVMSAGACSCAVGYTYFPAPSSCGICTATCLTCVNSGVSDCTSCYSNAHLLSGTVNQCTCVSSYYPSTDSTNCQLCDVTCLTCQGSGPSLCLTCKSIATISGVIGPCECPAYYSNTPINCLQCDRTCSQCSGGLSTECTACFSNATLAGGACTCNATYFPNLYSDNCSACDSTCALCNGAAATHCTACWTPATLSSSPAGTCVCPAGYSNTPINCVLCHRTCLQCAGGLSTDCTACYSNATLASGICSCNTRYFPNLYSDNCSQCDPTCATCVGAGPADCTTCNSPATTSASPAGLCICPAGYSNTPINCVLCHRSCSQCSGGLDTQCTSCFPNATLSSGICTCDATYFPNLYSDICSPCDFTCALCIGAGVGDCTSCWGVATRTGSPAGACVCPAGYSNTPINCVLCHRTCFQCSGGNDTDCTVCFSNATLTAGTCACNSAFFPNAYSDNCSACDSTCATCTESAPADCTSCWAPATRNASPAGACICPIGYSNTPINCVLCHTTCFQCSRGLSTDCTACFPNAVLVGGSCTCDLTYYPNVYSDNCSACDSTCATCVGSGTLNCTSCWAPAILNASPTGACVCPAGYSNTPANCILCHRTCLQCTGGNEVDCSACFSNAALSGGKCTCNTSYFPNAYSDICTACDSTCAKCAGSGAGDCTSCWTSAILSATPSGTCVCPAGYSNTPINCVLCHRTCYQCSDGNDTDCTACFSNATLSGGSCTCNSTYFPNLYSDNCSACDPTCATCVGSGAGDCATCWVPATTSSSPAGACVCPAGYSNTPINCVLCHRTCSQCSGGLDTDCTVCFPNAVLAGGLCTCAATYFPNSYSDNCSACDTTCATCIASGAVDCTSCWAPATLSVSPVGACVCPTSYSNTPINCILCHRTCLQCTGGNDTDCTACFSNAILSGGLCICTATYFPNLFSDNCSACDLTCATCAGSGVGDCTSCWGIATMNATPSGACVCPAGYSNTPINCVLCHRTCLQCTGGLSTDCTACYSNATLASGICSCNTRYFPNLYSDNCSQCDPTCATCIGAGPADCTTCNSPATTSASPAGLCICPAGYSNTPSNCVPCHRSCLQCSGGLDTECIVCFSNATLAGGMCNCNPTYFPNSSSDNCTACDSTCSACIGTGAGDCTSCWGVALTSSSPTGTCVCPSGYSNTPINCVPCHRTCLQCTGRNDTECTACFSNATLAGGTCSCNSGYFPNLYSDNCSACDSTCVTCVGARALDCTSCAALATMNPSPIGPCVCPAGYSDNPNNCVLCHRTCLHCSGSLDSECTACFSNADLAVGVCVCSAGYFPDSWSDTCSSCDSTCATCVGARAVDCTSCKGPATMTSNPVGSCVCPTGYSNTPVNCVLCHRSCSQCTGGMSTDCTACFSNAALVGGICTCDAGYFPNLYSDNCSLCDSTCVTCVGGRTVDCTSCNAPFVTSSSPVGACVCPARYYKAPPNCALCHRTCFYCSGATNTECTACFPNATLVGKTCICIAGYFPDQWSDNCSKCDATCETCIGNRAIDCTSCRAPTALSSYPVGPCVCGANAYRNSATSQCKLCAHTCFSCSGNSGFDCTACYTGAQLSQLPAGQCLCSGGFFPKPDGANCVACSNSCKTCIGDRDSECTACYGYATVSGGAVGPCVCLSGYAPSPSSRNCTLPVIARSSYFYASLCSNQTNTLFVTFTSPLSRPLSNSDFKVMLVADTQDLKWETAPAFPSAFYSVSLYFESQISDNTTIILSFSQPEHLLSDSGEILANKTLVTVLWSEIALNNSSPSALFTTTQTMSAGIISTLAVGSILTSGSGVLWILVNNMQMISYIPMSHIPLSSSVKDLFVASNAISMLPNPFAMLSEIQLGVPEHAKNMEINSGLFLYNIGKVVILLSLLVGALLVLLALHRIPISPLQAYIRKKLDEYCWGTFIRLWIEVYLPLAIFAGVQKFTISCESPVECFSALGSFVCEVTTINRPVSSFRLYYSFEKSIPGTTVH